MRRFPNVKHGSFYLKEAVGKKRILPSKILMSTSTIPVSGISTELFQVLKDDALKVLHSTCQQIWKTQQWPQDWKRSVFIPTPKKGNDKECSNYCTYFT